MPYQIAGRRAGDVASCYADAKLAEKEMGWTAKLDLTKMCKYLEQDSSLVCLLLATAMAQRQSPQQDNGHPCKDGGFHGFLRFLHQERPQLPTLPL